MFEKTKINEKEAGNGPIFKKLVYANLANVLRAGREVWKPADDGQDEQGRGEPNRDQEDYDGEVPARILQTEVADLSIRVLIIRIQDVF